MPNWGNNNPLQSPPGADPGSIWWDGANQQLRVYDGQIWKPLSGPGTTLNASTHAGAGLTFIPMVTGSIGGSPNLGASLGGSVNGLAGVAYDVINNRMWVWNGSAWKSAAFA